MRERLGRRLGPLSVLLAMTIVAAGCAASTAFRDGDTAMKAGNLDEAVVSYRKAVQASPDDPKYKIALQRAMLAASRAHLEKAREFEGQNQLEAAVGEYRLATEYDPSNRFALTKVAALERTLRERAEAARPKPAIQEMRERALAAAAPPLLNPASREPLNFRFTNASLRDVLTLVGNVSGISISYDRDVTDRPTTIQLDGVTLEQALNQIMTINQLAYKVQSDRSIFVFPDTAPKHAQYDEQVVQTFYISHADATEVSQILSSVVRIPQMAIQPIMAANKTANTITIRATPPVMQILGRMIQQNDKPRAEIVLDIEILEVDRNRAKSYGLNLSDYALGAIFSPEVSPATTTTGGGTGGAAGGTAGAAAIAAAASTAPGNVLPPPPFNLNTISRGVSTADFYLAVPTAVARFLESDTHTKVVAKPQLRGAEGGKLSFKAGQQIPIVSTSYTPIATGGAGVNPLSSYTYKDVGINFDMTPRVTPEGDILMDLFVEDSSLGPDKAVAGVSVPTFQSRTVTTKLRLRDGESNLLAGLVQQSDASNVRGFPGAIHLPLFKQALSTNLVTSDQSEIVILLTPHIVRTSEITDDDLQPLYIGSTGNLGIGGPPPLIAAPPVEAQPAPAPAPAPQNPGAANQPLQGPGGTLVTAPPGSSPVPGTVLLPQPTPPAAQPAAPQDQAATPPPVAQAAPAPVAAAPPPAAPAPQQPAPPQAADANRAAEPPVVSPGIGVAQVIISPPGAPMRVGGGPYTIPLSVSDATRLSTMTLTLIYDPTKLRVRTVQEGSFMRSGGASVAFAQQVNGNRIDITLARGADTTGASGTGLLAAVLFDAIAPGNVTLTLSGSGTGPGATPMGLQFRPISIVVQP